MMCSNPCHAQDDGKVPPEDHISPKHSHLPRHVGGIHACINKQSQHKAQPTHLGHGGPNRRSLGDRTGGSARRGPRRRRPRQCPPPWCRGAEGDDHDLRGRVASTCWAVPLVSSRPEELTAVRMQFVLFLRQRSQHLINLANPTTARRSSFYVTGTYVTAWTDRQSDSRSYAMYCNIMSSQNRRRQP